VLIPLIATRKAPEAYYERFQREVLVPITASVAFTPRIEKDTSLDGGRTGSVHIQTILFMEAYRQWSGEELRLADYSCGLKQGSTGRGGFGTSGSHFGDTGFGAKR